MQYASRITRQPVYFGVALVFATAALALPISAQTLDTELKAMPQAELAALARSQGVAARGAAVFFQQTMACSKCHPVGAQTKNALGPDLTDLGRDFSDEQLVEAVLLPSKRIRKGFESVSVVDDHGRSFVGLLVERNAKSLVLRDAERDGTLITLDNADVAQFRQNEASLMPEGQVNQLSDRQSFLDLIRYLMEIRDGGKARAIELQPAAAQVQLVLPEYEKHLDHAGMISAWDQATLQRGEAIYRRVCANCHGTRQQVGSLPTALRFGEGKFKNGADPLSMYRTLTHGFGFMVPQTWMVPSQKYDVIHYIREAYLKPSNPTQYAAVTEEYLAGLPKGDTRGPEPSKLVAWSMMDYGPCLTHTYEVKGQRTNFAYKGVAVRLDSGAGGVSRGHGWMVFDTDTLRVAAGWRGSGKVDENFIDWQGIQFDGTHHVHPSLVGMVAFGNATGPGWADPRTSRFMDDRRVLGRDGRRYGPLPKDWGKFRGLYYHNARVIFSYTVGNAEVLETPRLEPPNTAGAVPRFVRTLNVGPRDSDLLIRIAEFPEANASPRLLRSRDGSVAALHAAGSASLPVSGIAPRLADAQWQVAGDSLVLRLSAGKQPLRFSIWLPAAAPEGNRDGLLDDLADGVRRFPIPHADLDLQPLTHGGPLRWTQVLETQPTLGTESGPFAADELTAPETNPWLARMRFTGLDFMPDGRLALCTWDGDAWLATLSPKTIRWQRIASGMFQPLGLKVVNGKIHVTCRDQLTVLHDLNGDDEIDFYECLNNDHQVTEHFHEFAMGLQTDAQGNFYYAKSARHALPAIVPQHGTLLRVSRDGSRTEILANGFRAANGVCVNPDGSFVVSDQEGHWTPKNRINWVELDPSGKPGFYGNMLGYHDRTDTSDAAMIQPLCWITNEFDRSPAELLWVDSDRWGPLKGSLLNLSYGCGKVFVVPYERAGGVMQGGMIALPLAPFPTGIMRGRFRPSDGQLYACGMFAWAGNATRPGGVYRIRATGQPMHLPIGLHATKRGLELRFTDALNADSLDASSIRVKTWSLKRTHNYGSKHYDEKVLQIRGATLADAGKTLKLDIADIRPTWCMEIQYSLRASDGTSIDGTLHNTIHHLTD